MNQNEQLITSFYDAFKKRDPARMAACYGTSIHFSDPVFTDLHGTQVAAMWHMLCEQGTDLEVEFGNVSADDSYGTAHWEPQYSFGPKSRRVRNKIDARFEFRDGKIVRHVDSFDLWRWSRMALGLPGVLTGWSGSTQAKIRATANRGLTRFIEAHPEYR